MLLKPSGELLSLVEYFRLTAILSNESCSWPSDVRYVFDSQFDMTRMVV